MLSQKLLMLIVKSTHPVPWGPLMSVKLRAAKECYLVENHEYVRFEGP